MTLCMMERSSNRKTKPPQEVPPPAASDGGARQVRVVSHAADGEPALRPGADLGSSRRRISPPRWGLLSFGEGGISVVVRAEWQEMARTEYVEGAIARTLTGDIYRADDRRINSVNRAPVRAAADPRGAHPHAPTANGSRADVRGRGDQRRDELTFVCRNRKAQGVTPWAFSCARFGPPRTRVAHLLRDDIPNSNTEGNMSWKASVVRGAAIAWAIILIGAFVVFAGVTILMPSTKSGRIHFDRETEPAADAGYRRRGRTLPVTTADESSNSRETFRGVASRM
jgi:hypothetical protein